VSSLTYEWEGLTHRHKDMGTKFRHTHYTHESKKLKEK
jgi:hypothetical protein